VFTAIHSANLWWIYRQTDVSQVIVGAWPFLTIPFPLHLVQNFITTGLIVFKIWSQYRQTRTVGLVSFHTPSLVSIMRILVESAAIFTAGTLLMVVLCALDHPGQFIVHYCLAPLSGTLPRPRRHPSQIETEDRHCLCAHGPSDGRCARGGNGNASVGVFDARLASPSAGGRVEAQL
jgi:hypothetical protein